MCKTSAEGGTLCSTHTKPAYDALTTLIDAIALPFGGANERKKVRATFNHDGVNATNAIANYASTTNGVKHIGKDITKYKAQGDMQFVTILKTALSNGAVRKQTTVAATAVVASATRAANSALHGARGFGMGGRAPMTPSGTVVPGSSCADVAPHAVHLWRPSDNSGVTPDQVTVGSNNDLTLFFPECGHLVEELRVNLVFTKAQRTGKVPSCPSCQPQRQARFMTIKDEFSSLVAALGGKPEAFNCLPPALRLDILRKVGLMKGGNQSLQHDICMGLVHGDITLLEVLAAKDVTKLDDKITHGATDEDEDLHTLTGHELDETESATKNKLSLVDQAMLSVGVLELVGSDSDIGQDVLRAGLESLWAEACVNDADLDAMCARLRKLGNKNIHATHLQELFEVELAAVQTTPLPDRYVTNRIDADGIVKVMEPTLAQRRFASLVAERFRIMDFSTPGAGKTLAASLALSHCGAVEVLVVCPLSIITQWREEFEQGHGYEVVEGLPTASYVTPSSPRVRIVNYDQFQGDPKALRALLTPLTENVDAIIFDEIHRAKKTGDHAADGSKRHKALMKFTDAAGEANPNLIVIGASATPVVNNLSEAYSVMRLVMGNTCRPFATTPTIRNAAAAYRRLAAVSVRLRPAYSVTLTRTDVLVDITNSAGAVYDRLMSFVKGSKNGLVHPSMMEKALLPEKLDTIVALAKASLTQVAPCPSVIYTEYTTGMVNLLRDACEAADLRVGVFTGKADSANIVAEHAVTLAAFKRGDYDVLIASKPLATGVDGLQFTSHNIIVASGTWTAADDDQLGGRLYRHGQANNVCMTYVLTNFPDSDEDSWCQKRKIRVQFKRSIADAAVDGIMPDGVLEGQESAAAVFTETLRSMSQIALAS